ncbi:A24 family peptidase [uncultured Anaerovibrio sp.]|uniref:prepilin peptidase n=1 Tax=uncultured Anaerovibrio sp. TaxID=361586 RepID=UPI002612B81C|nr:A24 family peptidase [uncultured Anaerovibrio sp.]
MISDIFFLDYIIFLSFVMLVWLAGRGLLAWSGRLGTEYHDELEHFIRVQEPIEENKWLMLWSIAIPLICVGVAYGLNGMKYQLIFSVVVASVFLVQFSLTDFIWQIIFDKQLALFAILGLSRLFFLGDGLLDGLMAGAVGFAAFFLLAVITRGGFGGGDVKLIGAMGLWLGSELLLTTIVWGIIIGGIVALLLIITKKRSRREFFPYGPYFALTGMVLFLLTVH